MKKVSILSELYSKKIDFAGCGSNMIFQLSSLSSIAENFEDSSDLNLIKDTVNEIDTLNTGATSCRLW